MTIVITRVFRGPIERVWKAWTCMRAPRECGGQDMCNTRTYTRIVPLRDFAYMLHFADQDGNGVDPVAVG